ncbi:hypothetical protein HDV02_005442, partial [Globomyces sp. JEL0801]
MTSSKKIGLELSPSLIFKKSTLAQMASLQDQTGTKLQIKEIVVPEYILDELKPYLTEDLSQYDIYPSTPLQNGLVALSVQNNSSYVNQMKLKFKEPMDRNQLEIAFSTLTSTHDSLRTQFVSTSERIYSIVHPTINMNVESFTDLQDYCDKDLQKGFQVGDQQWLRCGLQEDGLVMVLTIHHVLYDGWSLGSLINNLFDCYDGVSITKSIPFKRVVEYIESQDTETTREYWSQYLKGVEVDHGLFGNQSVTNTDSSPINQVIDVDMKQLKLAASKSKVTLATLTKAAWALTLRTYSRKNKIVFGNVVSGRDLPVEGIEGVIGMLINTIPFKIDIDPTQSLKEFLEQVQQHQVESLPYSQTGLIDIQKWVGIQGQDKLFNSTFVFENLPQLQRKKQSRYEMLVERDSIQNFNSYDMTIALYPTAHDITYSIEFDSKRIEKIMVLRIASHFNFIASKMTNCINAGESLILMDSLMELQSNELNTLLEFGTGPKADIPYECAHYAFEEIARNEPDLTAVEHEDRSITYGELNQRAEEIASILMNRGLKVGDYVGLVTTRSIEMVCGIFGILKAGGAYIPIDHELPLERIQYMLELADCSTILYHPDIRQEVYDGLDVSKTVSLLETTSQNDFIAPVIRGDSPAYVVFTSGSTGKPKGVTTSHKSLQSFMLTNYFEVDVGVRVAQVASISFDVCVGDVFLALSYSGILVLRSSSNFFLAIESANSVDVTPTALLKMRPKDYPLLKVLVVGGEACHPSLINTWSKHAKLVNCYGPSEASITSSFGVLNNESQIHIGNPVTNSIQYIVDKALHLVPVGVPGELLIGGLIVALGYLNRPDLTAEKFIDNHFLNDGSKMYRTGDICKWTEDGNIQILGRSDDMVKVKGYRIELDEVSSAISRHPDVTGSAVIVKDDQLIAF